LMAFIKRSGSSREKAERRENCPSRRCPGGLRLEDSREPWLRLLHDQRPDVILADIGLPEQDGFEFMRIVRKYMTAALAFRPLR
jgi:hypothetical protein